MKTAADAEILRIFFGEQDRHGGRPLYEVVVERARDAGLCGATVLKGVLGFGADSELHSAKILRLGEDLPMVVEIVDDPAKIEAFLPIVDELMSDGLITIEKVKVMRYLSGS